MQLMQAWGVQQVLGNSMPLPCDAVLVFCYAPESNTKNMLQAWEHTYPSRLCSAPSHQYSGNVVQSQTSLLCLSAQQAHVLNQKADWTIRVDCLSQPGSMCHQSWVQQLKSIPKRLSWFLILVLRNVIPTLEI